VPVIGLHRFKRRSGVALDAASVEACAFAYRLRDGESAGGRVRLRDLDALPRSSLRRRRRKPDPQKPEIEIPTRPADAPPHSHKIPTWISHHGFAPAGLFFRRNHKPALGGKQQSALRAATTAP
jgi:hypothetical protein